MSDRSGTTLPARARRRCIYCGHRCNGSTCTYHRDLPRLDTGTAAGIGFAVLSATRETVN